MTTIEDVYNPNERNRWFYAEEGECLEVCPLNITNDLDCHISKEKTIKENLKIKHYIKFGEECPLCYEPIFYKKNAYLTDCGHSFHLSCIHSYEMANLYSLTGVFCPMCRSDMGMFTGVGEIYYNSKRGLDKLEDFWNNISYTIPTPCFNHILGLNNNCQDCINYRKCKRRV